MSHTLRPCLPGQPVKFKFVGHEPYAMLSNKGLRRWRKDVLSRLVVAAIMLRIFVVQPLMLGADVLNGIRFRSLQEDGVRFIDAEECSTELLMRWKKIVLDEILTGFSN